MSYPYKRVRVRKPTDRKINTSYRGKLIKQILWAIVIVVMVIIIKAMNMSVTNDGLGLLIENLNRDMDVKKTAYHIKKAFDEVPDFHNKTMAVFGNISNNRLSKKYVPPMEGEIVSSYGDSIDPILNTKSFQRGIDMISFKDTYIRGIDDGIIAEVGESENLGKYIKISHGKDVFAIYSNCTEVKIKKGDEIRKGDRIGIFRKNINKEHFHFELWVNGNVVDPTEYIKFKNII
jgi:murein DD-endopeptidase MepM/ murein hydrolase activator NlpD